MSGRVRHLVAAELALPVAPAIAEMGRDVAHRLGGLAVLFYGSVLRTGDLDGLLDFYVLTERPRHRGIRARLWPEISFEEVTVGCRTLRAKVAAMPLATFAAAAADTMADTTIWTRFVQPAALVWARDAATGEAVVTAVASAVLTATRYAAVQGEAPVPAAAWFEALFAETYRAELRVEPPGRGRSILSFRPERWAPLLLAGWADAGWRVEEQAGAVRPVVPAAQRRAIAARWRRRRRAGRPLNAARLAKAALTLDGAARYAVWKIERHTGLAVPLTPWRERHPLLAAPAVLWRVWRHRRAAS